MAQYSFEQISELTTQNGGGNQVGFFNLQNDGQEAIVRFLIDSTADFEILTVHDVTIDGKTRQVNCIRDAKEDISKCPLCATGAKLSNKLYIKMLQYTRDDKGNVTCEPKIWTRSLKMATQLKGYLDSYGPLSDVICKIVRHGARGSMQTTYDIIPNLSKQIYSDSVYVKDTSAFEGYVALGRVVFNKSFDELADFVTTGKFPQKQDTNNDAVPKAQFIPQQTAGTVQNVSADDDLPFYTSEEMSAGSAPQYAPQQQIYQQVAQQTTPQYQQPPQQTPWQQPQTTNTNRPVRRY